MSTRPKSAAPQRERTTISIRAVGLLCAAAASAIVLGGCSVDRSVDKNAVADQISSQLTQQVGRKPDKVECPGDLPARKDATLTCVLTDKGTSYDVHVTVTGVDGDKTNFDIKVDDTPKN